jgi:hypothetical protein
MFGLIEGIVSFSLGMVEMVLELAFGLVEMVLGLLGGALSLIFSLGGFVLFAVLLGIFLRRRVARKERAAYTEPATPQEEFDSFYDQYRTQA